MEQLTRYLGVITSLDGVLRYFPADQLSVLLKEDDSTEFRIAIAQASATEPISHALVLPKAIMAIYTNLENSEEESSIEYVTGESVQEMEFLMRKRLLPFGGMYAMYILAPDQVSERGWHWGIFEKQWISLIGVR